MICALVIYMILFVIGVLDIWLTWNDTIEKTLSVLNQDELVKIVNPTIVRRFIKILLVITSPITMPLAGLRLIGLILLEIIIPSEPPG